MDPTPGVDNGGSTGGTTDGGVTGGTPSETWLELPAEDTQKLYPNAVELKGGLNFLQKLRTNGNKTPVIMLTAMTGPENTIDGLSGGANDYLAKPFQMRELVLRLNNIIPHSTLPSSQLPSGLTLVDNEFFITKNNTTTVLTLSGEEKRLLQNLTYPMGNIAPASPMVAKRLRSKLNVVLSDLDIITIRGQGYKLISRQMSPDNKNGIYDYPRR